MSSNLQELYEHTYMCSIYISIHIHILTPSLSVTHFRWLEKSVCQQPTMITTTTTITSSRVRRAGALSATLHIFTLPVWFHIANKMADRRVSAMAPWHLPANLPATQWIERATYRLYTHIYRYIITLYIWLLNMRKPIDEGPAHAFDWFMIGHAYFNAWHNQCE